MRDIKTRFGEAEVFLNNIFTHFLFGGSGESRSLSINKSISARYIRLSLSGMNCLHIYKVRIFDANGSVAVDPGSVVSSSHYALDSSGPSSYQSEIRRRCETLVGSGTGHGDCEKMQGVHTDWQEDPFIIIDLGTQIEITEIQIQNRKDFYASRNWSIKVHYSVDQNIWTLLHDHLEEALLCRKYIEYISNLNKDKDLVNIIRFCLDCHFEFMITGDIDLELYRSRVANYGWNLRFINQEINRMVLGRFERMITPHGVGRPFLFWTEGEKQSYLRFCNVLITQIEKMGLQACLGYGAVLSFVRHGELMQHDDDIDIIALADDSLYCKISDAMQQISENLRVKGYIVSGDFVSHIKVGSADQHSVDVFFGVTEGNHVAFFPGPRKTIKKSELFPAMYETIHDTEVPIPNNPFKYLRSIYGKNWRMPDTTFQHNWETSPFSDIL